MIKVTVTPLYFWLLTISACGESSVTQLVSASCVGDVSIREKGNKVLRDEESFSTEFKNSTRGKPLPAVDFSRWYVAVAHAGQQASCGTRIEITSVVETTKSIDVEVTVSKCPGGGSDSLDYPVVFALVPRSEKPYVFSNGTGGSNCN